MSVNLSSSKLEDLKTAFLFHWFPSCLTWQFSSPPGTKDCIRHIFHLYLETWMTCSLSGPIFHYPGLAGSHRSVCPTSRNCYIYFKFYQSRFPHIFYIYNSTSSWNLYRAPLDPESENRSCMLNGLMVVWVPNLQAYYTATNIAPSSYLHENTNCHYESPLIWWIHIPFPFITFDALRSSQCPLCEHYSYLQLRHIVQQLIKSRPTPYISWPPLQELL